uniref:Uncharacterized protein n=1 Tax=Ditylenchus dipsaci TaxID=166011 RepID=A0A915DFT4_9BILA
MYWDKKKQMKAFLTRRRQKYPCDLKGVISPFRIYAPGLIDDVLVGDQMTSLLKILSMSGKPREVVERIYDSVLLSKVQSQELREISIKVRNMEGRLCLSSKESSW